MTHNIPDALPESMLTGVAAIDDDHRAIFDHIRTGMSALNTLEPAARIAFFNSVIDDFASHFAREEKWMSESGFRDTAHHAKHHASFLARLRQVEGTLDGSDLNQLQAHFEALDTLFRDALNGDQEFATWLGLVRPRDGRP